MIFTNCGGEPQETDSLIKNALPLFRQIHDRINIGFKTGQRYIRRLKQTL